MNVKDREPQAQRKELEKQEAQFKALAEEFKNKKEVIRVGDTSADETNCKNNEYTHTHVVLVLNS